MNELSRMGQLEIYQSFQSKPIFECDYIVSFIGFGGTLGRMFGVYRVKGRKAASEAPELPDDFLYKEFVNEDDCYSGLEGVPGFEDLNNRVVIEWDSPAFRLRLHYGLSPESASISKRSSNR